MRLLSTLIPLAMATTALAKEDQKDIFPIEKMPPAPVLSPEAALETFQVEPGFRIELVAAEPLVQDPVAIRFDGDGRMWVVELRGYMPNLEGKGEDAPVGRIMILEDVDGDGTMDSSRVFLDGLNQVRAIALVEGGLLYCEPPGLYFIARDGLKPVGEPVLIDPNYAKGGNVEHKANGLLPALDNWLYNSKSDRRYRFLADQWVMEKTEGRGQWGISQDDFGRLFHNANSSGLRGDSLPPSALMRNPAFRSKEGMNRGIGSNRIHSIRPNAGINRGYRPGMLDEAGKLKSFTGASGPCIYRGDQFPANFYGNGFTPEPCGNLVKRFLIEEKDGRLSGKDPEGEHSFLASTDERFRPVSIENGPDGTLYVVDMYRGIIQHKTYVTGYLRRHILARELDQHIGLGRIYRIVAEDQPAKPAPKMLAMNGEELVGMLSHRNGWVRDTAQQLLVQGKGRAALPALIEVIAAGKSPRARMHALWVLEGLGKITPATIAAAINTQDAKLLATAIRLATKCEPSAVLPHLQPLLSHSAADVRIALALYLGELNHPDALELLAQVLVAHGKDKLIAHAAVSGLAGRELDMLAVLKRHDAGPGGIQKLLQETADKAAAGAQKETHLTGKALASFQRGKVAYSQICFGCHGNDGAGVVPLAPPLVKSEWVTGDAERLAHIVLNGLQGPIEVAGKKYAPPEIQPIMPGIGAAPEFTNEKLADILTYVRNAWGNKAEPVSTKDLKAARKSAKTGIYTPEELLRK